MVNEAQPTGAEYSATTLQSDSRKRNWVTVFVILAVLFIGTAYFVGSSYTSKPSLADAERAANEATKAGDYKRAVADLQAVVGEAHTNSQKEILYNQLAETASDGGQLNLSIHYFVLKHQVAPSTAAEDSYMLAELYHAVDENTQAIAQYKLYISYLQAHPQSLGPYSVSDEVTPIETIIQSLENKQ